MLTAYKVTRFIARGNLVVKPFGRRAAGDIHCRDPELTETWFESGFCASPRHQSADALHA